MQVYYIKYKQDIHLLQKIFNISVLQARYGLSEKMYMYSEFYNGL